MAKPATIRELYEQATESERHQFLAGIQPIIRNLDNKLRKRQALARNMLESGIAEKEIENDN